MDAKDLLRQAKHITIIGHVAPDGDVVGSMLGLGLGLEKLGKHCVIVSPDPIPDMFRFLPGFQSIVVAPRQLGPTDLVVVLDATDPHRIGAVYETAKELLDTVPVLVIDHHPANSFSCTASLIDPAAAAVAEQVFELLVDVLGEAGLSLDPVLATCLLTGLVSDTQCFRTSNSTPRSLRIAAALVDYGALLSWIVEWLFKTHPFSKLALWGQVLGNVRMTGRIVWSTVSLKALEECGARPDETEGLIEIMAGVSQAEVAILFKETPGRSVKASLRSIGDANVSDVARRFDGGGHPKAAGFTVKCGLDEVEFAVVRPIDEILSGS